MMNRSKQATLFQSWGGKSLSQQGEKSGNNAKNQKQHKESKNWKESRDVISLFDSDDEDKELALALEQSLAQRQSESSNDRKSVLHLQPCQQHDQNAESIDGNVSFGIEEQDVEHGTDVILSASQWKPTNPPVRELAGYDRSAGKLWIYPTNYPVREYQFNIVRQALVKNTLVTLPTGLGKTFIAAVLMYNFYRWYPEGKVVFMAPTKPLVAQQIEACYNIMGIPRQDTAEMTGSMNPTERQKAWRDRRVFFLTPQVMTNDLSRGTCTAEAIKLVVVDEAHKALGNHAYCQVVRELIKYTNEFRVLALSATPGNDIKAIQKVVSNLLISHIELRSEDSPDIKPYTHERTVDKIVVPLGKDLNYIKGRYSMVLHAVVKRLTHQRVLYNREPTSLSKFLILKARDAFRQNPPESMLRSQYGIVEGDFAMAMSLYHGFELLQLHGSRSLHNFLEGILNGSKSSARTRSELMKNTDFTAIVEILRKEFQPSGQAQDKPAFRLGHPKLEKLEEVVLEHFQRFQAAGEATRVMIFSQYRDSVQEISTMLQQHSPLVKVMSFIGQSSAGKGTRGFTQKQQLQVMQSFHSGEYNTLVSTCVGEEGLDIGEVDLIICYDAHKSPVRLVQRMGRTGRKRQGRIVMLMTEGKEEQIYNQSQYTKRAIHRTILNGARTLVFYANNPRMIPTDVTPECHRMHITVPSLQPPGKPRGSCSRGSGRGRSVTCGSKAKRGRKKKGGLETGGITVEEFVELKSAGCAVTSRAVARPVILTLNKDKQHDDEEKGNNGELSLADWLPWQNGLQETSLFGHSRRSQHLVDLLEFTDLQQALPPDEDNYGQEMKAYLEKDDVLSDPKHPRSNSITQFVVPVEKVERQAQKAKKANISKQKKQENAIQNTGLSEHSDDSDFLPEVGWYPVPVPRQGEKRAPGSEIQKKENQGEMKSPDSGIEENESESVSSKCTEYKQQKHEMRMSTVVNDNSHSDDVDHNSIHTDESKCMDGSKRAREGFFRIPTPPPIEEIDNQFNVLNIEGQASFDMQALIKELNETMFGQTELCCYQGPLVLSEEDSSDCEWWKGSYNLTDRNKSSWELLQEFKNDNMAWKTENQMLTKRWTAYDDDSESECSELEDRRIQLLDMLSWGNDSKLQEFGQSRSHSEDIATLDEDEISDYLSAERNTMKPERWVSVAEYQQQTRPSLSQERHESSHCTSPSGSAPGKQQKQVDTEVNNTSGNGHKSFPDTSVSDSFFHKNFFDDDEDFEGTNILTVTSPATTGKGNFSPRQHSKDQSKVEVHGQDTVVAVTFSELTPAAASPRFEAACANTHNSMLTFTQALSFVHNPSILESNHDSSNKTNTEGDQNDFHENSENMSVGQITTEAQEVCGKDEDLLITHEDEDFPNFDLGYDFDEDIIPPSPEGPSVSQVVGKSVTYSGHLERVVADKKKDSAAIMGGDIPCTDDFDDDGALLCVLEQGMEDGSPCFSSSFQPKQPRDLGSGKVLSSAPSTADKFSKPCITSGERDEVLNSSRNNKSVSLIPEVCFEKAETESPGGFDLSSHAYNDRLPDIHMPLKLSAIGAFQPNKDNVVDVGDFHAEVPWTMDDSFTQSSSLRVEHKAPTMDDNDFELESDPKKPFSKVSFLERSPVSTENTGKAVYCSTPMDSKRACNTIWSHPVRILASKPASPFPLEFDDEDDFEESAIVRRKPKRVRLQSPENTERDDSDVQEHKHLLKKKKRDKKRKRCCDFLDNEAELSDDVAASSDEDEENMEAFEGSFIDNCTQMTQASQIDMQAVYMKSVRSPVHSTTHQKGRFRLQFNPDPVNVYSQLPSHLEEESQYQEDSFCVGSYEESSCDYSEEDESLTGKISKRKKVVKQMKGRKRVRQIVDSSSDENEGFDRLPQSQIVPPHRKSVKALLSSSDEHHDTSAAKLEPSPLRQSKRTEEDVQHSDTVLKHRHEDGMSESSQGFSVSVRTFTSGVMNSSEDHVMPPVSAASASPVFQVSSDKSRKVDCVSSDTLAQSAGDGEALSEQKDVAHPTSRCSDESSSSKFTSIATRDRGKMVILVDSREISSAQDIVSALRLKHNACVYTQRLGSCDYILSNRMAAERIIWSYFCKGSNRSKLLQRLKSMLSMYDRCVLIVEKDRVRPGEEKSKKFQHRRKYVMGLISQLCQIAINFFFTENQCETASLLFQLATLECRKGMAIKVPVDLSAAQEQVLWFYLGLPMFCITHALNLIFNFTSVHDLMESPVDGVETKGHMSLSRAKDTVNFVRRRFSLALCSSK